MCATAVLAALLLSVPVAATASRQKTKVWAARELRQVTRLGVLDSSPPGLGAQVPLTEGELQAAIEAIDRLQHAPPAPVETPAPHVPARQNPGRVGNHPNWRITAAHLDGESTIAPIRAPAPPAVAGPGPARALQALGSEGTLYRAASPSAPVSIRQLDAALVGYLGLGDAASHVQAALAVAGLDPRPGTGTEVLARLLGLRFDHPAAEDNLELLPDQSATRAEAAYSLARVLRLDQGTVWWARAESDSLALPSYGAWQRRLLAAAVGYVGFPYVWGGTSPTAEAPFGVEAPGGFDCSGFVWRVYKLTSYPDEGDLAAVLRGRTTYVMSGEVPRSKRIRVDALEPGDVMFFGVGRRSKPSQVDHTAIYLGDGWFVQASGDGVTLAPFDEGRRAAFAWARRPLREAGLV